MRSFARTGGRLKPRWATALAESGHRYLIGADSDGHVPTLQPEVFPLEGLFPDDDAPLVIEVGSGGGHQAVAYAAAHPGVNVLALEVWRQGLASTVALAEAAGGLANLRIAQADAAALFEHPLPSGRASEVWTFFPDPWPKVRHRKRRIVNAGFAAAVARVLRPGGVWRCATDWEDYGRQMRDVVGESEHFEVDPAADAHGFSPRWEGRVLTRYEKRGLEEGRSVWDVTGYAR
ncbi:MAG TPA: tRNA (guanosine(46)-N7)-methyltransferase TrmB [Actinomycetales bacterium]|nr:tRNA (guanosine(46)-N7)-methyltransferase TrmB [Actinomycetales bacterium]